MRLSFELQNAPLGTYIVQSHFINNANGSVHDTWLRIHKMENLLSSEISSIKDISIPHLELALVECKDGVLRIETSLLAHEIRLIEVRFQY